MYECDDWRPEGVKSSSQTSDPTASKAIYAVDDLSAKLQALKSEQAELLKLIGESLAIIDGMRNGFGEIYANLLEWHYVDKRSWTQIHDDYGIPRTTCYYLVDIAFDWIDSVGVSRLLRGVTEV